MSAGGSVLWLIAILAAFMWAIILERIWYFNSGHQAYMTSLKAEWESIDDHSTWKVEQIKDKLISGKTEVNRASSSCKYLCCVSPFVWSAWYSDRHD